MERWRYLLPVLYRASLTRGAQIVLGAAALAANVIAYALVFARSGRSRES